MPVDRPTPSGPPSWPVPKLRPESAPTAEPNAPAGPPPLSAVPPPWPDAPHLREPERAPAPSEPPVSLPPWPSDPIWPAAPHLRDDAEAPAAGLLEEEPRPSASRDEPPPRPSAAARHERLLLRPSTTARKVIAVMPIRPGPAGAPTDLQPASSEVAAAVPAARIEGGPVRPHVQDQEPPIPDLARRQP